MRAQQAISPCGYAVVISLTEIVLNVNRPWIYQDPIRPDCFWVNPYVRIQSPASSTC